MNDMERARAFLEQIAYEAPMAESVATLIAEARAEERYACFAIVREWCRSIKHWRECLREIRARGEKVEAAK